jgi:predicted SAM-dependent methyltransferase
LFPYKLTNDSLSTILSLLRYYPNKGISRYCPVCKKWSKKFGKSGLEKRENAVCLYCGSLERHRLVWLYFERMTNIFDGHPKQMLHVAPELAFENRLKKHLGAGYLSADIRPNLAMIQIDITHTKFPSETFDAIYCSHVLEHISDDASALREFYRVLKPTGWAIILVPVIAGRKTTFEDGNIRTPKERQRFFGQKDHVRLYGRDFVERLRHAGFAIKIINAEEFLTKTEMQTMGVSNSETIYFCEKLNSEKLT